MEPMTLAASAAALLTPYWVKAAGKAAEKIGEKTVEALPAAADSGRPSRRPLAGSRRRRKPLKT